MISYVNLKGNDVDFSSRSSMAQTFGSWMSVASEPSEIVDWCNRRIKMYEEWIKECTALKSQTLENVMSEVPAEVRLKGMTKEQLQAALAALE